MLLALDVGNTSIHIGVFKGQKLEATWRIGVEAEKLPDEYGVLLLSLLATRNLTPQAFDAYAAIARAKGFLLVAASPLTRSSYHAGDDFKKMQANRNAQLERANG